MLVRKRHLPAVRRRRRGAIVAVAGGAFVLAVVAVVVSVSAWHEATPGVGAVGGPESLGAGAGGDTAWTENFDGAEGSAPNPDLWTAEIGDDGWGNNEEQDYTAKSNFLDGDSHLIIEARRHTADDGSDYWTSGRLTSIGKSSFSTGTLSARIKLPDGQGLLPAFWLMGDSVTTVGWPASGEIDVVETPNSTTESHHNIHGPNAVWQSTQETASADAAHSDPLSEQFHVFSVSRTPGRVTLLLDGAVVSDLTRSNAPEGMLWVFDDPFHYLFSLAVGGDWPGPPDSSTPDVSRMVIDWVKYVPEPAQ
jgi:beta-glucanase (GH16 family)